MARRACSEAARPASAPRRLRDGVQVDRGDGGASLFDPLTGLDFQPGDEFDADDDSLWQTLEAAGLTDSTPNQEAEVRPRQQAFRLDRLLDFALREVPYYRARASRYRNRPLQELPLMRKADLRAHFPKGLVAESVDVPKALARQDAWYGWTSGSADERTQTLIDGSLSLFPLRFREAWGLPSTDEEPRLAILTTPLCMGAQCHLGAAPLESRRSPNGAWLQFNSTDDLFSISDDRVSNIATEWADFRPEVVMVEPFYLHWIALRAEALGRPLGPPRVVVSGYQLLGLAQRRALERLTNAPVRDLYGATDLGGGGAAIECSSGRCHVRCDHVLLEILDSDGRPLTSGVGHAAITTLANRMAPLMRYLVGDLAEWTTEECDCSFKAWPTLRLHGRAKDALTLDGRLVTGRDVDQALGSLPGVDFYKLSQTAPASGILEVVSEGAARGLPSSCDHGAIRDALRRLGLASVEIRAVRRLDPERSKKFRTTVPHLPLKEPT